MTTSVRFCLSYDTLEQNFITFKMNTISIRKRIADTDIVNDVTCMRQSVITRVVIWFLWHDIINWITAMSYKSCRCLSCHVCSGKPQCMGTWGMIRKHNKKITLACTEFCMHTYSSICLTPPPRHQGSCRNFSVTKCDTEITAATLMAFPARRTLGLDLLAPKLRPVPIQVSSPDSALPITQQEGHEALNRSSE